jgi:hypothetical protein
MKKIVTVFFLTCLLISCTNKIYNSSSWQSRKVTIDGKISEWSNPLRFYDQETGMNYNISNDIYNIYFVCSISNEFLQTKILRSGLEFRIDTLGKKTFAVGIKYPTGKISVPELKPDINPQTKEGSDARPDRSSFRLKLPAEATEIQLVGFKLQLGKIITLSPLNNTGISAAIDFDARGIMNYEAVIPFSTFYKNELTPSDSGTVFNFQIKVNPLANSNYNSSGMRGSGMRGGGMGGGMRGGMGGGGMRGGGMGGGGMGGGGMNAGRAGDNVETGNQRNTSMTGVTKTTIKLKLAYR